MDARTYAKRKLPTMKGTTIAKIFVDIAMTVIFLILTYAYDSSPLFHEVAGISMGVLFGTHMALNWKGIKAMIRLLGKGKLSITKIISLLLDVILIIGMPLCVITGMLIARNLYVGPGGLTVDIIHTTAANICLYVLAGHLVLHARYVAVYIKQTMRCRTFQRATGFAGAMMLVFGLLGANFAIGTGDKSYAIATTTTTATNTSSSGSSSSSGNSQTYTPTVNDKPQRANANTNTNSATASTNNSSTGTVTSNNSTSSNQSSVSEGSSTATATTTPTNCTLCKKMCPLTALECTKGVNWAESNGYI